MSPRRREPSNSIRSAAAYAAARASSSVVRHRGDVQDAAAVRHDDPARPRRARVEDERAGRLRALDPLDRRAAVAARGVRRPRRARRSRPRPRPPSSADATVTSPAAAAASSREQVAVEQRQHRLRLRIAEAAVVLEHPRPVRRSASGPRRACRRTGSPVARARRAPDARRARAAPRHLPPEPGDGREGAHPARCSGPRSPS